MSRSSSTSKSTQTHTNPHPYPGLPDVPPLSLHPPHSQPSTPSLEQAATTADHAGYPVGPLPDKLAPWHQTALQVLLTRLRALRADHVSGSRELATDALATVIEVAEIAGGYIVEEAERDGQKEGVRPTPVYAARWWAIVRRAGWVVSRYGRPSMEAPITSVIVRTLEKYVLGAENQVRKEDDVKSFLDRTVGKLKHSLEERKHTEKTAAINGNFCKLVQGILDRVWNERDQRQNANDAEETRALRILTLCSSSTVQKALIAALQAKYSTPEGTHRHASFTLRIMETRPLFQGASFARSLITSAKEANCAERMHIEIATDASVAMLSRNIDLVVFGADRISNTGDVCNRMGSYPAVLCAKTITAGGTIVATVSELEKVALPTLQAHNIEEDNDPAELTDAWHDEDKSIVSAKGEEWGDAGVQCRNVYFEWVPSAYVDWYVTENGCLRTDKIEEWSRQQGALEKEVFGDLVA